MKKDIVIPLTTDQVKISVLEKQIESIYEELHKKLDNHREEAYITCEETCFCWCIAEFLRKYEEKLAKKNK